jgi:exosortase/archaeosortase family protein
MAVAETNRSLLRALAPRAFAVGITGLALFTSVADPVRTLEARAAARIASEFGGQAMWLSKGLVIIERDEPVFADVTRSCSSAASIVALALLLLVLRSASPVRRARALALGSFVLVAVNMIRIVLAFVSAARFGDAGLVVLHEWVGPIVTVLGMAMALSVVGRVTMVKLTQPRIAWRTA